jgi:hypothetical protein
MTRHERSIDSAVLERIRAKGAGYVFTAADFLDLGGREAIRQVLSRSARKGEIRKLARGLYDYPDSHPKLGVLHPGADAVARALAGRDAVRLQLTGAAAANALGLTTQVPMRVVYLTEGASREVQIGNLRVQLRKTTPRQMATAGRIGGMVIQALRWLGKRHVDDSTVELLRSKLEPRDRRNLREDARFAPDWVAKVMRRVAGPEER